MIKSDGNGGVHLDSWKMFISILGIVITIMVVMGGAIGFVAANRGDINNLEENVDELKEETVTKEVHNNDIDHLEEKLDDVHTDVKNILYKMNSREVK